MRNEPSLLLIDDMQAHDAYLRMMKLDSRGWTVESAIDPTVDGAVAKAREKIDEYEGFSIILLDILWPHENYGGIKILHKLYKAFGNILPTRRVLIVTRKSIKSDPQVTKLADKLRMPVAMRTLMLDTGNGRDRLKECLLQLWRQVQPQD